MYNLNCVSTNYLGYLQLLQPFSFTVLLRPALHNPLGGPVNGAGRWDGKLGTFVPASRDTCPTVMDLRLQVFCFIHGGQNGAGSFWRAVSVSCAVFCSGSGSLSVCGSVTPYKASLAGAVCLGGINEHRVNRHELNCESCDSGPKLCDDGAVTHRGRC